MSKIQYRELKAEEIDLPLFSAFRRRQVVTDCYRRKEDDSGWVIREDPFVDEWSAEDYAFLVECLKNTVCTGGLVYGAFYENRLKGFVSVEAELFGTKKEYLDLTSIHVSEDMRGRRIGAALFHYAAKWAKEHGGIKLYISSHSAVETQAFYEAMGCVDAAEKNKMHVEREPYDRQLEYVLS